MTYKSIVLTVLILGISFGALISGCNRDRGRTAMKTAPARRNQSVRPAEVLSASAYRPPARNFASAPMPVQAQPAPVYASAPAQPYYAPAPAYATQPVVIHPTPELAMARASMTPMPPPPSVRSATAVAAPAYYAPIPELEPARYRPVVAVVARPATTPSAVMISNVHYQGDRQEIQRALAPLPQAQPTIRPLQLTNQGWVSSPTTAMRPLNF